MKKTTIAVLTALMMLATAMPAYAHETQLVDREDKRQIVELYRSTAKYHRVQNVLNNPDFGPFALDGTDVPTCFDDPDKGGMGIHYVRNVGDGEVDALNPEAMVYEITRNGLLRLVAVEYVVVRDVWDENNAAPPTLFGQTFTEKTFDEISLTVYKLHVWIWKWNPNGMFADFNPRVGPCPGT